MAEIDFNAIEAEVGNLTPEQLREQLVALRTRQKVAQKKYQNPERQKAYQMKARERQRLLKERAMSLGIYDEINTAAEKAAEAKLAAEAEEAAASEPETANAE